MKERLNVAKCDVTSRMVAFIVVSSKQNRIHKATLLDSVFVSVDKDIPQNTISRFSRKTAVVVFLI